MFHLFLQESVTCSLVTDRFLNTFFITFSWVAMIPNLRESMERNEVREGPIAIAVDKDKTSCQALKWAVEQYIPRDRTIKLVHVIQRSTVNASGHSTDDELSGKQNNDKGSRQFLPMRCLCTRRNVSTKTCFVSCFLRYLSFMSLWLMFYSQIQSEVVMLEEDQDVAKALIEYISQNFISTFLLGASLKKSITRSQTYLLIHDISAWYLKMVLDDSWFFEGFLRLMTYQVMWWDGLQTSAPS